MTITPWLLAGVLVAAAGQSLHAHDGHDGPLGRTFGVGKNGEVNIREDVKVSAAQLIKKGKYRFEHRLDGDQHLIVLTSVDRKETPVRVYELRTTTLASKAIAKKTEIVARELTDHSLQIALVSVAGEAFEHLPATVPLATN